MKPRAKQIWAQKIDGVKFTIWGNKKVWGRNRWFQQVQAYTTDDAILVNGEGPNGTVDKQPVFWLNLSEVDFLYEFTRYEVE